MHFVDSIPDHEIDVNDQHHFAGNLENTQEDIIRLTIHLADNALIIAQRNAEWCGHGPVLEQDIALTNISLDLLGQARNFYQYAASILNNLSGAKPFSTIEKAGNSISENSLVFLRNEREFKNCLLVEQPNGDWGQTILRQFFFSAYQYLLYGQLQHNKNELLAAIAAKAIKEVAYHVRWSSEWVIRLGDGTEESRKRMLQAIDQLWGYTGELFMPAEYENENTTGFDLQALRQPWLGNVKAVFQEATLEKIVFEEGHEKPVFMHAGGKQGVHSEHLGFILAELQYLQRAYPGCEW